MAGTNLTNEELTELVKKAHRVYSDGFQKAIDLVALKDGHLAMAVYGMAKTLGLQVAIPFVRIKSDDIALLENRVLDVLSDKAMSMQEIYEITGISHARCTTVVKKLIASELVVRIGVRAGSKYCLKDVA